MTTDKNSVSEIIKILKLTYPDVKTQLDYQSPFQLLIATILSAQCTDKQVNIVTKELFLKLSTPLHFANADIEEIENLIRKTGFFRNKAKNIKNCSIALIEKHKGIVPDKLDELVKLPGVGRKTANVVLGAAFKIPGVVVDTHVARISQRLGLTSNKDPVKIEFDIMKLIPNDEWSDFSLQLVYHGRSICLARRPDCNNCPLSKLCKYYIENILEKKSL